MICLPQSMSMVCGNVTVHYMENKKMESMGKLRLVFLVLTMSPSGHIEFPLAFESRTKAALRLQATALLRKMVADPHNPVDAETWAAALTGQGTHSIFKPAPKRAMVVHGEQGGQDEQE